MARVPVIKVVNVSKKFELGKIVVGALENVNLEIYSGEFVMFFGPSGCGKSTLMSMIAGLQPPSTGKIYIRGEDLTTLNDNELAAHRRTKIGMVFQAFNLISSMNVLENIALPLTFARIPKGRRMNRAENLLDTVGMGEYKKHTPSELSGGQQQRIALARSLVANPWIVLADEPTGNLDSKSADEVMRLLISLNRKSKRTVILITHNPDYLVYADRIFHVKDGKIVDVEVNSNAKMDIVKQKDDKPAKGKKAKADKPVKEVAPAEDQEEEAPATDEPEEAPVEEMAPDTMDETTSKDETAKSKPAKKKKDTKIKPMRLGK